MCAPSAEGLADGVAPEAGAPFALTVPLEITPDLVATLVARGGYVHPLFNPAPVGDNTDVDSATAGAPLPGQAVLLLMGGLAEQSGVLDDAIALVEIGRVRFLRMLRAGSSLQVRIEQREHRLTSSGKRLQDYRWTGLDRDGQTVVEADIVMLMSPPERK